jgi:hypothetical protein
MGPILVSTRPRTGSPRVTTLDGSGAQPNVVTLSSLGMNPMGFGHDSGLRVPYSCHTGNAAVSPGAFSRQRHSALPARFRPYAERYREYAK